MNLCCSCYHRHVCEDDLSSYGIDSEYGITSCVHFRSESNVEMCVKFFSEFMKIWKESDFPEELEMYTSDLLIQLGINEDIDDDQ